MIIDKILAIIFAAFLVSCSMPRLGSNSLPLEQSPKEPSETASITPILNDQPYTPEFMIHSMPLISNASQQVEEVSKQLEIIKEVAEDLIDMVNVAQQQVDRVEQDLTKASTPPVVELPISTVDPSQPLPPTPVPIEYPHKQPESNQESPVLAYLTIVSLVAFGVYLPLLLRSRLSGLIGTILSVGSFWGLTVLAFLQGTIDFLAIAVGAFLAFAIGLFVYKRQKALDELSSALHVVDGGRSYLTVAELFSPSTVVIVEDSVSSMKDMVTEYNESLTSNYGESNREVLFEKLSVGPGP
tara:strand:- start:1422 stop:2315 length:894 start_codon:yes stop_codon:yes gene_type:complete